MIFSNDPRFYWLSGGSGMFLNAPMFASGVILWQKTEQFLLFRAVLRNRDFFHGGSFCHCF